MVADAELLIFTVVGEIEACTVADMLPFNHPLVEACILVRREDSTCFYARFFGLVIVHNEGSLAHSWKDEVVTGGVGRDVDKGHTGIFSDLFRTPNGIFRWKWTNEVKILAIVERPKPFERCVWLVGHIADFVKAVVIQCRVDLVLTVVRVWVIADIVACGASDVNVAVVIGFFKYPAISSQRERRNRRFQQNVARRVVLQIFAAVLEEV